MPQVSGSARAYAVDQMRCTAALLVVLFTATPVVQAVAIPETAPCPMAGGAPDAGPCVTAPCPCDHSAPGALVRGAIPPATLVGIATATRPAAARRRLAVPPDATPRAGHPFQVDHPPSSRA